MEYKILSAQGARGDQALESKVNAAMEEGFFPAGGVCVTTHQGSGTVSYYQAVAKHSVVLTMNVVDPKPFADIAEALEIEIEEDTIPLGSDEVLFQIPDMQTAATPSAIAFASETLGDDYESILLDLYAHQGRKVNKADVREIAQVEEVIHAD